MIKKTISCLTLTIGCLSFSLQAQANNILILTINGATSGDIASVKAQLGKMNLSYDVAATIDLNNNKVWTVSKLESYTLIINPGGNSITMGDDLNDTARANVKAAIENGTHYFGICAGAFMAETASGYKTYQLTPSWFDFYEAGAIKMVTIDRAGTSSLPVVYWDGPYIRDFGYTVAKYSNGETAIAEGYVGKGFVLLSGIHSEALYDWSCSVSKSPCVSGYTQSQATNANAYSQTLINAALKATMLNHY